MCRREFMSLFLCRLVFLVARVLMCQWRDTCVVFASSACVRKETSSLNTQNTWSANRLTRTNTIVGTEWASQAPFTGYLDKRVPQRILCNALLATSGAENASCRTHRALPCPRANYRRCFFWFCVNSLRQRNWCAETWKRQNGNPCPAACASQQRLPSLLAMTHMRLLHGHVYKNRHKDREWGRERAETSENRKNSRILERETTHHKNPLQQNMRNKTDETSYNRE